MNVIFKTLHGSRLYGTHTEESDYDYKGIVIPTKEYFLGFLNKFEQHETKNPDCVLYDIRKFFKLAADCNPNIIEVLFAPEECFEICTPLGQKVLDIRDKFLSKKAKHTFAGYAHSQLKRMKTHRAWLMSPPKVRPDRKDYGLPENQKVVTNLTPEIYQKLIHSEFIEDDYLKDLLAKELAYQSALKEWNSYENWKANRNPERAEIERKYGIDTKNSYHLIRLLRMCVEILETGQVIVRRPDAEELLAIRNGAWSYEQILKHAEELDKKAEELYATTTLPHSPDRNELDRLCIELVEKSL